MTPSEDGLFSAWIARGVSRRTFLKFSAAMAAALAIPASYTP
jgi:Ni,Fe-hydrogenase I small subunit